MRNCTNGDAILKQPGKCLDLPGRITGGAECIMHLCWETDGPEARPAIWHRRGTFRPRCPRWTHIKYDLGSTRYTNVARNYRPDCRSITRSTPARHSRASPKARGKVVPAIKIPANTPNPFMRNSPYWPGLPIFPLQPPVPKSANGESIRVMLASEEAICSTRRRSDRRNKNDRRCSPHRRSEGRASTTMLHTRDSCIVRADCDRFTYLQRPSTNT